MGKVRLVGGPFGGKVIDNPRGDGGIIVYRGPKKMTRKQKYEHEREAWLNRRELVFGGMTYPQVEARYEIAMRPQAVGANYVMAPCCHPDGSVFYEYMKNSKREVNY